MKTIWKFAIVMAFVCAGALTGFVALVSVSTQWRDEARAKVQRPAAIVEYEALRGEQTTAIEPDAGTEGRASAGSRRTKGESTIAAFADIFRRAAVVINDPEWGQLLDTVNGRTHYFAFQQSVEVPGDAMPALRSLVDAIQPLLRDIRAAAAGGGPVCALDLSRGIYLDLSHLGSMRYLARLLRSDAIVAGERGDTARVVDDVVAIMHLGEALADEPVIASQLARMGIASTAYNVLKYLPDDDLAVEQYERMIAAFSHAGHREHFAAAYGGQATMIEVFFDQPPQSAYWVGQADNLVEAGAFQLLSTPLGAPVRNVDESAMLKSIAKVQELALLAYFEAAPRLATLESELEDRPWWSYSGRLLPGFLSCSRFFNLQGSHEENMVLARLGLAIEKTRLQTGAYPQSLHEIGAEFPDGVSVSPLTGKPFVYWNQGDEFLLYGTSRYPRSSERLWEEGAGPGEAGGSSGQ